MTQRRHWPTYPPGTILGYRKNGRPIYPIAGGSGEGAPAGGTPQGEPPAPAAPKPADPQPIDWKAEAERLRAENEKNDALRQKHEKRAKENYEKAQRFDALQRESQTELERAVTDAREEGRREARAESRARIARSEVIAAAAVERRHVSPAVLDRLNLADLVGDDGEVDATALKELVAGFAPIEHAPQPEERRHVASGQGTRSSSKDRGGSVANGRELYAERHKKT